MEANIPKELDIKHVLVQLHNTGVAKMGNVCMFDCMCYIYLSVANNDGVLNRQTMAAGSLAGYQWFHRDTTVVHNGSTGIPMVAQGYHIFNKFCTLSESFGKW